MFVFVFVFAFVIVFVFDVSAGSEWQSHSISIRSRREWNSFSFEILGKIFLTLNGDFSACSCFSWMSHAQAYLHNTPSQLLFNFLL